jgi:hypothetical protein
LFLGPSKLGASNMEWILGFRVQDLEEEDTKTSRSTHTAASTSQGRFGFRCVHSMLRTSMLHINTDHNISQTSSLSHDGSAL